MKRTLELTHAEIELIDRLLSAAYNDLLHQSQYPLLSGELKKGIVEEANKYADLQEEIANGNKDA